MTWLHLCHHAPCPLAPLIRLKIIKTFLILQFVTVFSTTETAIPPVEHGAKAEAMLHGNQDLWRLLTSHGVTQMVVSCMERAARKLLLWRGISVTTTLIFSTFYQ